jgi:hypothetical protein
MEKLTELFCPLCAARVITESSLILRFRQIVCDSFITFIDCCTGSKLYSCSDDRSVRLWSLENRHRGGVSGPELIHPLCVMNAHTARYFNFVKLEFMFAVFGVLLRLLKAAWVLEKTETSACGMFKGILFFSSSLLEYFLIQCAEKLRIMTLIFGLLPARQIRHSLSLVEWLGSSVLMLKGGADGGVQLWKSPLASSFREFMSLIFWIKDQRASAPWDSPSSSLDKCKSSLFRWRWHICGCSVCWWSTWYLQHWETWVGTGHGCMWCGILTPPFVWRLCCLWKVLLHSWFLWLVPVRLEGFQSFKFPSPLFLKERTLSLRACVLWSLNDAMAICSLSWPQRSHSRLHNFLPYLWKVEVVVSLAFQETGHCIHRHTFAAASVVESACLLSSSLVWCVILNRFVIWKILVGDRSGIIHLIDLMYVVFSYCVSRPWASIKNPWQF